MPLVRLEVRNEYGLGQPELYRESSRDDPKAVLDGIAVAGLVGILRQLGDLADFAAEVFHGLQEQVMTTASRSRRLMVRVQNIEASLPPLEKAVLAQTSHIHFAYTAGCEWHPRIEAARNHFIYNDLPQFIMDSYEECHDPPRLHLLDKFDTGGPGSSFKRYSDPAFFKRVSADSDETYSEKTAKARKSHKSKKKKSSGKNGELLRRMQSSSGRMQYISPTVNGRTSSSQTASTIDMTMKSDLENRANSFDSKASSGYIECVFHHSNSVQSDKKDCKEPSSLMPTQKNGTYQSVSPFIDDSISHDSLEKQVASSSSVVTWDEKEEIVEPKSPACDVDKTPAKIVESHDSDALVNEPITVTNIDFDDILFDEESNLKPVTSRILTDDVDSEPDNYMDALNSIESETVESEYENDLDYETKLEAQQITSHATHGMFENGVTEATSNLFNNDLSDAATQNGYTVTLNKETGTDFADSPQENYPFMSEPHELNLGSAIPSDVPNDEEMIGDIVSLNKGIFGDLPDAPLEDPLLTSEPPAYNLGYPSPSNVSDSEEMARETVSLNKETFWNLPGSPQEIAPLPEPHEDNLGYVGPSDAPVSDEKSDSDSSESPIRDKAPQTCTDSSAGSHTVNDTMSTPIDTDISFSGSKSSNLQDEEAGRINNNNCRSEETPRESSGDRSVRFWTNGGLLGLEPSKPPDFNVSSSLGQGSPSTAKIETDDGSCHNSMQKNSDYKEERDLSEDVAEQILKEPSSRCLTSSHNDDDQASISTKTSGSSHLSNGCSQTERNATGEITVIAPESVLPAVPDRKACAEPNQVNGENSSRVFGLGHRLLINSFHRKVSVDEKPGPYHNSLKSILLDQNEQNGIIVRQLLPETIVEEKVSPVYPIDSLPPSPPLEHMKISFHPVNGLETSKLKLKFPDGSNHRDESIRDTFPSFQLVPESSIPLDDAGYHSDGDETFCRSSPYVSDDCLSPRSDYDSDQWESEETPESSDHGVYDSPHRRSSTESMLGANELGGVSNDGTSAANGPGTYATNGVEPSLSGPLLDFPSFENVNHVLEKESNKHSECDNDVMLHSNAEPTPPPPRPPPPPPTQWRILKSQLDMTNGTQHYMSEDAEHINDQSLQESTPFQRSRLPEVEQIHINNDDHESLDSIIHKLEDKLNQQKLSGQKEVNQLIVAKEVDEREDFLQQIRTKSFNLRRTVTEKPNATAGPTASVKVSAILEKANAIRQVVASDEGEDDDNWSDT